jgi:uncharacterized ferritin-like protein (DUF455 family)
VELRDFALRLVTSEDLEEKLGPPTGGWSALSDRRPGPALCFARPGRPPGLAIVPASRVRVPALAGMADPEQRGRILHALANHELQAAELFAWALLAFPEAPGAFRRGLVRILLEEQRHTRMYAARLEDAGARFGDFPVNGYFWGKARDIASPLGFLCAMSLTFENANLDHTVETAEAARRAGDEKSAAVIEAVQRDEVGHVRFGWTWLQVFKRDDESAWDAYRANLAWPLRPAKAKGRSFNRPGREAAGLDDEFIRRLEESEA